MDPLRIVVTSIGRGASLRDPDGFVRIIDWNRQRMLTECQVPKNVNRRYDMNPRGGLRGARGVSACGNRVVLANTERLLIFDERWRFQGDLAHPWMGDIHDILAEPDGIWVTAAAADLLLKIDWQGRITRTWDWRRDRRLTRAFGFGYLPPMKPALDYRDPITMWTGVHDVIHLNAVSRCPEGLLLSFGRIRSLSDYLGRQLVSTGRRFATLLGLQRLAIHRKKSRPRHSAAPHRPSAVKKRRYDFDFALVLLREDESWEILKRQSGLVVPNHNVVFAEEELIYNDSNGGRVVAIPLKPGRPERAAIVPGSPSFARGLARLDRDTVLVGSQYPPAVHEIHLGAGRAIRSYSWKGVDQESVYGIEILPPNISDPPPQLNFQVDSANRQLDKKEFHFAA